MRGRLWHRLGRLDDLSSSHWPPDELVFITRFYSVDTQFRHFYNLPRPDLGNSKVKQQVLTN